MAIAIHAIHAIHALCAIHPGPYRCGQMATRGDKREKSGTVSATRVAAAAAARLRPAHFRGEVKLVSIHPCMRSLLGPPCARTFIQLVRGR